MTTGSDFRFVLTADLVAAALDQAQARQQGAMDTLAASRCHALLRELAARLAPDGVDCYEPRCGPDRMAEAYSAWAVNRCIVERAHVLRFAARRVLGDAHHGRRGAAHFLRDCGTDALLRAALDELQGIATSRSAECGLGHPRTSKPRLTG